MGACLLFSLIAMFFIGGQCHTLPLQMDNMLEEQMGNLLEEIQDMCGNFRNTAPGPEELYAILSELYDEQLVETYSSLNAALTIANETEEAFYAMMCLIDEENRAELINRFFKLKNNIKGRDMAKFREPTERELQGEGLLTTVGNSLEVNINAVRDILRTASNLSGKFQAYKNLEKNLIAEYGSKIEKGENSRK